ncbi:MAG: hypothetical protein AAF353_03160 [Pseudomonadota bacterium]
MRIISRFTPILLVFVLSACSEEALTPEEEIRQFIEQAVESAEKRSADELDELMHRDYLDQSGYNKKALGKLLRLYFFRHKNIYLFTRIDDIHVFSENEAEVDMHLAMAGSVIADVNALASLRARMYRFELRLLKDEEWLLQHAKWSPASIADMQ